VARAGEVANKKPSRPTPNRLFLISPSPFAWIPLMLASAWFFMQMTTDRQYPERRFFPNSPGGAVAIL